MTMQLKFAERWQELSSPQKPLRTPMPTQIKVLPSLEEAFTYIERIGYVDDTAETGDKGKVRVFITGSIHLVGRALSLLEGVEAL